MKYSFDELKRKISIIEIAEHYGYQYQRGEGVRVPVYRHENGDSLTGCLRFSFAGVQALCARCAVFLCLRAKCGLIREENYDRNGASP